MLAGNYVVKAPVAHRYRFGMSYSLQRYEGGNTAALMAVSDTARNVGSVYAYDEWQISRYVSLSYGANYAHYDYLGGPALFSPRLSATFSPTPVWRLRVAASREVSAPGAEEFLPPSSAEYLPPQRTFSPISNAGGIRTQELQNYEFGIERVLRGAAVAVRVFDQRIDDQTVTVFGLRRDTPSSLGHYYVGAAGDANARGVGVT
jgi:outer membrane receptor protein involved in Fe transport